MTKRSKMQSQAPSPTRTNAGDTSTEEIGNHTAEISELIASEMKKQLQKDKEELKSEITSEIKKEISAFIASEVKKQLQKHAEERITIMKELITASQEDTDKKLEETKNTMESLNEQYRKEIDRMKESQRKREELDTSITRLKHCLKECEDRVSRLEDTITTREKVRRDLLAKRMGTNKHPNAAPQTSRKGRANQTQSTKMRGTYKH